MQGNQQINYPNIQDFTENSILNSFKDSTYQFHYQQVNDENNVDPKLDQDIKEIQKKYSIASNCSQFYNNEDFKLKEWTEQSKHILLTQLVPEYLNDISQQMIYGFENEVELKTKFLQKEMTNLQLINGQKSREIGRLTLDLSFMVKKNDEREKYYEQKWNEILKQIEKREQQFAQIGQEKTKYWIERINELTTLFLEVKNFILSVRNHIPREVYMGELFRFKRLFNIEELQEKSIYSQNHKEIWELYHDLETKQRSLQTEKEYLKQGIENLQQQNELKDKTIKRLNMEIIEYQQKIDHLEEDNRFYIQEIDEVKQETEQLSQTIEEHCQDIIMQKNSKIEIFHLKYLSAISQQDQIINDYKKQIQNLETFLSNLNKEHLNLKRENSDLKKEISYLNEQKSRQARIYEDSLYSIRLQKDSLIQSLQKQIESDKLAYDGNKKALEEIHGSKTLKWQTLYKNLISKIRVSDQGISEKESQLTYEQIQDQNSLEMLKQLTSLEEKIEAMTEEYNFIKEQNSLMKDQIDLCQNEKNQLQQTLEGTKENFERWMKESEEAQVKIKVLTQKLEQQRQQIEEYDKQLQDLLDKKRRFDKEQFQQKMKHDLDIKAIKQQCQREFDKLKRELEDKMELQITKIKNEQIVNKDTSKRFHNNSQLSLEQQIQASRDLQTAALSNKQSYLPQEIQEIVQKAVQAREAILLEEQKFNETSIKAFYDNAIKQLCEDFEKEQKTNELKLKEFYDNLLSDSKKHHSKLQESLISDNVESYDQVIQEALQKSSQFEAQCLLERQLNLELSLELKRLTLEQNLLQKKIKDYEEEIIQLKYKLEEENLENMKQKRLQEQKMVEIDYQYRVEKEKYLSTLRREKDISKQLQILETTYQEQLKSKYSLSAEELNEIKQVIKQQYEEQVNKLCMEQSMQIQRFSEEFSQFKELSNKRYNQLKLKYEDILLIHQTQKQLPIKEQIPSKSPSPQRQREPEFHMLGSSTLQKERNITSRAYTSLTQYRDDNKQKTQDFSKFSYSTDLTTNQNKESNKLSGSNSDVSKQEKMITNQFNLLVTNQSQDRYNKQKSQQNISTNKDDMNFEGTVYLKKYPFTKVNQHIKNYSSVDPKRELNQTFSITKVSERSNRDKYQIINKMKSLTPNKVNQSLDIDQLDEQQKRIDFNKKIYRMRKFNIFESCNMNNDQDVQQREYTHQLDNINVNLNQTQNQFLQQLNKTGYGQTFTEQINFKHNQLYSTLKHFKNNTIKIERKQIKLSNLPKNGSNN